MRALTSEMNQSDKHWWSIATIQPDIWWFLGEEGAYLLILVRLNVLFLLDQQTSYPVCQPSSYVQFCDFEHRITTSGHNCVQMISASPISSALFLTNYWFMSMHVRLTYVDDFHGKSRFHITILDESY